MFVLDVPDDLTEDERQQQTKEALQAAGYADSSPIVIFTGITRGDVDRVQLISPQWWQE